HRARLLRSDQSRGAAPPERGAALSSLDRMGGPRELLRPRLLRRAQSVARRPSPSLGRLRRARVDAQAPGVMPRPRTTRATTTVHTIVKGMTVRFLMASSQ